MTLPRVPSWVNSGSGAYWARGGAFTLKAWNRFCFHEFVQTTFDLCELLASTLCGRGIHRLITSFCLFWIRYLLLSFDVAPIGKDSEKSFPSSMLHRILSFSSRSTVFQKEFSIFSYRTCLILCILFVAIPLFYYIISEMDDKNCIWYSRCGDIFILLWHSTLFLFFFPSILC